MHSPALDSGRTGQARQLSISLARSESEVREAQKLRWLVFGEEMGARLPSAHLGLDQDIFDPWCDHLLVREQLNGEVIGTYRILRPDAARGIGGYYSDNEFDLTRLANLRGRMAEVGRSCVHPDYRTGATIAMLWAGLAHYMRQHGCDYLIGCASISMADGGHNAAAIYRDVAGQYLSPIEWRVRPRCPLPLEALDSQVKAELPPLIKGYLRLGAYVGGEPAWDPDFNSADLFILLPMARINQRYARHFLGHSL